MATCTQIVRKFNVVIALTTALILGGCGGSDTPSNNNGNITTGVKLTGTVATGAAIANATITLKGANGNEVTVTSDANGEYSVNSTTLTSPVLIKVETTNLTLYSVATTDDGVANITPFTDLVIRNWYQSQTTPMDVADVFNTSGAPSNPPTATEVQVVKNVVVNILKPLLEQQGIDPTNYDPIETPFTANGAGVDGVLDRTRVDVDTTNQRVTVTNIDLDTGISGTAVETDLGGLTDADSYPPTAPTSPSISGTSTDTKIVLTWNAWQDNVGVVGYNIYRNGVTLVGKSGYPVFTDSGLTASTQYCYGVEAFDAAGNTSDLVLMSGTCPTTQSAPDTAAPSVPDGVVATATTTSNIDLTWNPATDDSGTVSGYVIERATSATGTFMVIGGVTGLTSFTDKGRTASTQYCYQVRAYDAAGNRSAASTASCATTKAPPATDTTAPSVPTNVVASRLDGVVLIYWAPSTDDTGVAGYVVKEASPNARTLGTALSNSYLNADTFAAGQTYCYTVTAKDAAGNFSGPSAQSCITIPAADTTAPAAPTNATAIATSGSTIQVSWTQSADTDVAQYEIWSGTTKVGVVGASFTAFVNVGLTDATNYCYTVKAIDTSANASVASNQSCATTFDTTAPVAPTGVGATATSATAITLSWTAATDNVAVTGYDVYAGANLVGSVAGTTFNATGLIPETQYCYTVKAKDAANNTSAASSQACATTPAAPDTTAPTAPTGVTANATSSSAITVSWTAATDNIGVAGYNVYRDGSIVATDVTVLTFGDTGLSEATQYCYTVKAKDAAGNFSGASAQGCATTDDVTPPSAPTTVGATATSDTMITVDWSGASDNVGVTAYDVYRDGALVASDVAAMTFGDSGLTAETQYCYTVRAKDAVSNTSGDSSQACATTQAALPPDISGIYYGPFTVTGATASTGTCYEAVGDVMNLYLSVDHADPNVTIYTTFGDVIPATVTGNTFATSGSVASSGTQGTWSWTNSLTLSGTVNPDGSVTGTVTDVRTESDSGVLQNNCTTDYTFTTAFVYAHTGTEDYSGVWDMELGGNFGPVQFRHDSFSQLEIVGGVLSMWEGQDFEFRDIQNFQMDPNTGVFSFDIREQYVDDYEGDGANNDLIEDINHVNGIFVRAPDDASGKPIMSGRINFEGNTYSNGNPNSFDNSMLPVDTTGFTPVQSEYDEAEIYGRIRTTEPFFRTITKQGTTANVVTVGLLNPPLKRSTTSLLTNLYTVVRNTSTQAVICSGPFTSTATHFSQMPPGDLALEEFRVGPSASANCANASAFTNGLGVTVQVVDDTAQDGIGGTGDVVIASYDTTVVTTAFATENPTNATTLINGAPVGGGGYFNPYQPMMASWPALNNMMPDWYEVQVTDANGSAGEVTEQYRYRGTTTNAVLDPMSRLDAEGGINVRLRASKDDPTSTASKTFAQSAGGSVLPGINGTWNLTFNGGTETAQVTLATDPWTSYFTCTAVTSSDPSFYCGDGMTPSGAYNPLENIVYLNMNGTAGSFSLDYQFPLFNAVSGTDQMTGDTLDLVGGGTPPTVATFSGTAVSNGTDMGTLLAEGLGFLGLDYWTDGSGSPVFDLWFDHIVFDGTTVTNVETYYDQMTGMWTPWVGTNDWALSASTGGWVPEGNDLGMSINGDGSVSATEYATDGTTVIQTLTVTASTQDISGGLMTEYAPPGYSLFFADPMALMPAGSQWVEVTLTPGSDVYYSWNDTWCLTDTDPSNDGQAVNGNCNTIHYRDNSGGAGTLSGMPNATALTDFVDAPNNYLFIGFDGGNNTEYVAQFVSGVNDVNYYAIDWNSGGVINPVVSGGYTETTVGGQTLISFDIPASVQAYTWDTTMVVAVVDGAVRQVEQQGVASDVELNYDLSAAQAIANNVFFFQ